MIVKIYNAKFFLLLCSFLFVFSVLSAKVPVAKAMTAGELRSEIEQIQQKIIQLQEQLAQLLAKQKTITVEGVFVQLNIEENKVGSSIEFSLQKAGIVYGDYNRSISVYDEKKINDYDYTMTSYDASKKQIAKYFLSSSRFIFWDGSEPETGGIAESDSGIILTTIPYNGDDPVAFIKIKNNQKNTETGFITLPVEELKSQFKQVNYCKKENERGDYSIDKCCSGLIPSEQVGANFICTNCGDGKCSPFENSWSCPKDCEYPVAQKKNSIVGFVTKIWSWLLAGISFPFNFLWDALTGK